MAGAADVVAKGGATPVTALTLAKDAYEKAIARIGNKRNQTLQQYGYRASGYDDRGNPTGLGVDQYNQYGEFQKMLHDDALLSIQAMDDSVGRGLGGAGLGNQGESEVRYQHGERSAEMGRLMTNEWTGMNEDRLQADQDYAQAKWEAQRQAALDAMAAQSYAPAPVDPYPPYDPPPFQSDPHGSIPTPQTRAQTTAASVLAKTFAQFRNMPAARRPISAIARFK